MLIVGYREEHEDALLYEVLLCLKALCTTALALRELHQIQTTLFPALIKMLFDEERKGPSEFTTRGIIISLMGESHPNKDPIWSNCEQLCISPIHPRSNSLIERKQFYPTSETLRPPKTNNLQPSSPPCTNRVLTSYGAKNSSA